MSLSRVTNWSAGNTLTASALNGEFNNILNNALALISPLSGALDFNGYGIQNLSKGTLSAPGLYFTADSNTGLASTGADVLDLVTAGARAFQIASASSAVNYLLATPAATAMWPTLAAQGADTNIGVRLEPIGTGFVSVRRGQSTGDGTAGTIFWPSLGIFDEDSAAGPTGLMQITTGTIDLVAGGVRVVQASAYASATNHLRITPGQSGTPVIVDVAGGDTNIDLTINTKARGSLTLGSADTTQVNVATAFVPATAYAGPGASPSPITHGLYRDNVVKAWLFWNGTTGVATSYFNVSALTHNGVADWTLTWQVPFAHASYCLAGWAANNTNNSGYIVGGGNVGQKLQTTSARITVQDMSDIATEVAYNSLIAIGVQ